MLFLLFEIGSDRYCLEASRVIEVTPLVSLRRIPSAPSYVSGLMSYRGKIAPVIDLSILLGLQPSRPFFSTRIVLVRIGGEDGAPRLLGLMAEKATETISRRKEEFQPAGITMDAARFLGDVAFDESGMVQRLDIERMLSERVREILFSGAGEAE